MTFRTGLFQIPIVQFMHCVGLLLALSLSPLSSASEIRTLRLSCIIGQNSEASQYLEDLYNKALAPLHYRVKMIHAKPQELISLLQNNEVDGSCVRDRAFVELTGFKHLIPLEHPSLASSFYAVRLKSSDIESDDSQLIMGHMPSLKRAAELLASKGYKALKSYASAEPLFAALRNGDIDLAALPDAYYVEFQKYSDTSPFTIHEVIFTQPGYAYLAEQHRALIKPFSRRIAAISSQSKSFHETVNSETLLTKAETLVFGCTTRQDGATYQEFEKATARALRNIGYNLTVVHMPRAREQLELEVGRIDGSCAKSRHYIENVSTNIVRIDAPVTREEIDIFSTNPERKIGSIADFKSTDRIALVRGTQVIKPMLDGIEQQLHEVNDIDQGLKMLAAGELDYFIDFRFVAIEHLKGITLKNPIYTAGHLSEVLFYPVLHKKHTDIAPALAAELNKILAADGRKSMVKH